MFNKALLVALFILSISIGLYVTDDYFGDRVLQWYNEQRTVGFRNGRPRSIDPAPMENVLYMMTWRFLNNGCTTLSEWLAPTPQMNKREDVDKIQEQDYYYDSWHNTVIVIHPI